MTSETDSDPWSDVGWFPAAAFTGLTADPADEAIPGLPALVRTAIACADADQLRQAAMAAADLIDDLRKMAAIAREAGLAYKPTEPWHACLLAGYANAYMTSLANMEEALVEGLDLYLAFDQAGAADELLAQLNAEPDD